MPLGAAVDGVQQFLRLERLGQVIDGTGLDCLYRQLGRGVGGDHQNRQVRPALVGFPQEIVAAHPLEARVCDDHEITGRLNGRQPLLRRLDGVDERTARLENRLERLTHVALVIHDQ